MKVSKRAQAVPPSATMAVTTKAKELKAKGVDVVGFGAGEPDFDTPQYIKDAAIAAMRAGNTKYTATPGIPELRKAIADKLKRDNGLTYTPEQIIVNIGAKHSVYESMQAVLDEGDEVIVPTPYWVTYPETIKLAGAVMKVVQTDPKNDYKITPEQLKKAITPKTAMLLINSPNNPGGFTYTPDELKAIAKVLEGTEIMVLSDEIYERLVYGDTKFISFAALSEDAYKRTITINGFSKAYAMTGWRLGYVAGPIEVVKAMSRLQGHMTQNPVSFVQAGGLVAFGDTNNEVEKMRVEFEKRAKYMADRLGAIEGVKCSQPTGAFYCFPDVSAHFGRTIGGKKIENSMDFAAALLEQANVALVPGGPFGCDNNVRLSFATSMELITKGIDRIEKWLAN
ncbi:MAG: pyridoxal phosphate-dependent aminotransferase [Planctomycetes bacterium]|nr:pyridoxal phosphate-dependent aminotransferase [Planctomycetota bacterium]MBU1518601.1 pyridoxal phosphate-dependent aminotransferase [Planctomycetota bacterium]MBU2457111.1 pyridoxal phosphate-dependent aminotransferase [Planctomycetota bacterium]MBU2596673.1 pyridoxal phosphate-dependent aminotransferase [Planctomycetota bacterium]